MKRNRYYHPRWLTLVGTLGFVILSFSPAAQADFAQQISSSLKNKTIVQSLLKKLDAVKAERIALLQKYDSQKIIPRMREIFDHITTLQAHPDATTAQQIISLEHELAVVTQQYLKGLSASAIEQLKTLARTVQDVKKGIRSIAPEQLTQKADIFDTLLI